MKKVTNRLLALLMLSFGMVGVSLAQTTYNVTLWVNTSTVPDTLKASDIVQIRGALTSKVSGTSYGTQSITWDSTSTVLATNMGGDYWKATVKMAPGDTLEYKYWIGLGPTYTVGSPPNGGWEPAANRKFILPETATQDTSLALTYYDLGTNGNGPFVQKQDSIGVFFRVDVGKQIQTKAFNPATDSIQVRGSVTPLTWDGATKVVLDSEAVHGRGENMFYSGVAYFSKTDLNTASNSVEFKFYGASPNTELGWEGIANRTFTLGSATDTTIYFSFFNDEPPSAAPVITTKLNFAVNVGILEGLGLFNSSIDSMEVRGDFNNWGSPADYLDYNAFNKNWELNNKEVTKAVGDKFAYKYYVHWNPERFDSTNKTPNYIPGIVPDNGYELPGTWGGSNRVLTIENQAVQTISSAYFSGIPPEGLITDQNTEGGNGIDVTFKIDMTAAMSNSTPFIPATDSVYMIVEEPMLALTQGWTPGESSITSSKTPASIEYVHFMPESAGSKVYTLTIHLKAKTLNAFAFRIWYGQPFNTSGNAVGNGGGFDPGRYYYQYIIPTAVGGQIHWPSTYTMPTLTYQFAPPLPYDMPPDYQKILTAISDNGAGNVPAKFSLSPKLPESV